METTVPHDEQKLHETSRNLCKKKSTLLHILLPDQNHTYTDPPRSLWSSLSELSETAMLSPEL